MQTSFQTLHGLVILAENMAMRCVLIIVLMSCSFIYGQEDVDCYFQSENSSTESELGVPTKEFFNYRINSKMQSEDNSEMKPMEIDFDRIFLPQKSNKSRPSYRTNSTGLIIFSVFAIAGFSLILLGLIAVLTPFFALLPFLMKVGFSMFLIGIVGVGVCSLINIR